MLRGSAPAASRSTDGGTPPPQARSAMRTFMKIALLCRRFSRASAAWRRRQRLSQRSRVTRRSPPGGAQRKRRYRYAYCCYANRRSFNDVCLILVRRMVFVAGHPVHAVYHRKEAPAVRKKKKKKKSSRPRIHRLSDTRVVHRTFSRDSKSPATPLMSAATC